MNVEITVHGDAYRIEPGATYAIEISQHIPAEHLARVREQWEAATGAKAVFLANGVRLVSVEPPT